MRFKLIGCNVFLREACWCVAQSPHRVDVEFTELGEHVRSAGLREIIQGKIDAAEKAASAYDAILLLFGLCGNAAVGLRAGKTPLVIPRAHDCCTILLGSRAKFQEHFGAAPSTPFSSAGYLERGSYFLRVEEGENRVHYGDAYAELVQKYGEDNARYIWEEMHPENAEPGQQDAVFIDMPQTRHLGHEAKFRQQAEAAGKTFRRLEGDIRLIRMLINGEWPAEEFLIVPPGKRIAGVYDWNEVVREGE